MEVITLKALTRTYVNNGQHAEQVARYTLTGRIEKADNKPFTMGGDCGDIQIKTARCTVCMGLDLLEHMAQDGATRYGYVNKTFDTLYIMTPQEWFDFIDIFGKPDIDSRTGEYKIRLKDETQGIKGWLREHL